MACDVSEQFNLFWLLSSSGLARFLLRLPKRQAIPSAETLSQYGNPHTALGKSGATEGKSLWVLRAEPTLRRVPTVIRVPRDRDDA